MQGNGRTTAAVRRNNQIAAKHQPLQRKWDSIGKAEPVLTGKHILLQRRVL